MRGIEQIPIIYEALMALFDSRGLRRWRLWLASGARGRTLEVGCGTGRNLPLYGPGVKVIGIDPSEEALQWARRRAPRALLVRARAEALPFRDGAFDTVVSGLVFCSVADLPRGLAEVKRVLKAGGMFRMLEHVRAPGWRGRWQDFIQPAWTRLAGGCRPNRDTEAQVEAAGFRISPDGRRAEGNLRRFSATSS